MNKTEKSKSVKAWTLAIYTILQSVVFAFLAILTNFSLFCVGAFLAYVTGNLGTLLFFISVGIATNLYLLLAFVACIGTAHQIVKSKR